MNIFSQGPTDILRRGSG